MALIMRTGILYIWMSHQPGSPVNPIELKPHPTVWAACWLVLRPGLDSYCGRLQSYHSPLGWGFLFLLSSRCELKYPGFPGSLSFCFTYCNMPPFLLPCSGHLHYSPLELSSGWQRGMANRCRATHSLVCFGPLMHNQDQIDDMLEQETADWFLGLVHYMVRGELHSQVMFQLKTLRTSAVCWP